MNDVVLAYNGPRGSISTPLQRVTSLRRMPLLGRNGCIVSETKLHESIVKGAPAAGGGVCKFHSWPAISAALSIERCTSVLFTYLLVGTR